MNIKQAVQLMVDCCSLTIKHIKNCPHLNRDSYGEALIIQCKKFKKDASLKVKTSNINTKKAKALLNRFKVLNDEFCFLVESETGKIKKEDGFVIRALVSSMNELDKFFAKLNNNKYFFFKKKSKEETITIETNGINYEIYK